MATDSKIDSTRALWYGIAFSFAFVMLIWVSGAYWLEPAAFADRKPGIVMWYHWQLSEPTLWTKLSGLDLVPDLARADRQAPLFEWPASGKHRGTGRQRIFHNPASAADSPVV